MRLSTKGRYAVMAMADLAGQAPGSGDRTKPVALADIAERQDISLSYLEQLFAKLRRSGLVTSVRGPGGGYRLARPSSELRIADIIVAVDEPIAATRCKPNGAKGCTKTGARCVTHDLWEELGQQIHIFLSSVSLADVVERRVLGKSRPCNDFDGAEAGSEAAAPDFEAA
jgi:Rrf2 family iron-sulfur cluster assembly transcriptional regulator